ncbi:MAG: SUMF1/EgtB/PvdO family nonheme iron enzyme, partial [Myxococcota bacterium]
MDSGAPDAGEPDASLDASTDASADASDGGADARSDAGADSGPDSGADAGFDAGTDSGFDAGATDDGADAGTGDAGDGIKWIQIPAGKDQMGCSPGDTWCQPHEMAAHEIDITQPFWIMETEVTQGQYKWVTGVNPSEFDTCGVNCPVESVDWTQAKSFCEKVGGRLPTEAEWEHAARAGTTTKFYCGDGSEVGCPADYLWYSGNSGSQTHPVRQKKANAWGLYDMLGNIIEWVEDDWHDNYNISTTPPRPDDGSAWVYDPRGSGRAFRGGSWQLPIDASRVS